MNCLSLQISNILLQFLEPHIKSNTITYTIPDGDAIDIKRTQPRPIGRAVGISIAQRVAVG